LEVVLFDSKSGDILPGAGAGNLGIAFPDEAHADAVGAIVVLIGGAELGWENLEFKRRFAVVFDMDSVDPLVLWDRATFSK
jgi:hypothetical protein